MGEIALIEVGDVQINAEGLELRSQILSFSRSRTGGKAMKVEVFDHKNLRSESIIFGAAGASFQIALYGSRSFEMQICFDPFGVTAVNAHSITSA